MKLINTDELMYEVNNIFLQYAEFNHWLAKDMYNRMKFAVQNAQIVDAEPVVRCKKCIIHNNCFTEDTFNLCGIENPFCCAGKRKDGE
jgi:hypothetical protein